MIKNDSHIQTKISDRPQQIETELSNVTSILALNDLKLCASLINNKTLSIILEFIKYEDIIIKIKIFKKQVSKSYNINIKNNQFEELVAVLIRLGIEHFIKDLISLKIQQFTKIIYKNYDKKKVDNRVFIENDVDFVIENINDFVLCVEDKLSICGMIGIKEFLKCNRLICIETIDYALHKACFDDIKLFFTKDALKYDKSIYHRIIKIPLEKKFQIYKNIDENNKKCPIINRLFKKLV